MSYFNKEFDRILYEIYSPVEFASLVNSLSRDDEYVKILKELFKLKPTVTVTEVATTIAKLSENHNNISLDHLNMQLKYITTNYLDKLKDMMTSSHYKNLDFFNNFIKDIIEDSRIRAKLKVGGAFSRVAIDDLFNNYKPYVGFKATVGRGVDSLNSAKTVATTWVDEVSTSNKNKAVLAVTTIAGLYMWFRSKYSKQDSDVDPVAFVDDIRNNYQALPEVEVTPQQKVKIVETINTQIEKNGLSNYFKPISNFANEHQNLLIPILIIGAVGLLMKYKYKLKSYFK
jgi:hypothetical protein